MRGRPRVLVVRPCRSLVEGGGNGSCRGTEQRIHLCSNRTTRLRGHKDQITIWSWSGLMFWFYHCSVDVKNMKSYFALIMHFDAYYGLPDW